MNFDLTFTDPPPVVQQARLAMARLERHLFAAIGPLDPSCDQSSLAFAFLDLEDVYPPYRPLPLPVEASEDPRADLDLAIQLLTGASASAGTAVDTLRYAYAIRYLRELDGSPYLVPRTDDGAAWRADPRW